MMNKIVDFKDIEKFSLDLKKQGKKIVTCNGSFDLLHMGHIKFLEEAKAQGDILIVGINSDRSIKKYKGNSRPINNEKHRAEFLAAIEFVDYVTIIDLDEISVPLVEAAKPDVHVNGEEYGMNCIEAQAVKENGGRLHLVKNYRGISTTKLIKKIMGESE